MKKAFKTSMVSFWAFVLTLLLALFLKVEFLAAVSTVFLFVAVAIPFILIVMKNALLVGARASKAIYGTDFGMENVVNSKEYKTKVPADKVR